MITYLITGYAGFVGQYFLDFLEELPYKITVIGISRKENLKQKKYKNISLIVENFDLNDSKRCMYILEKYRPNYILHLAGISNIQDSWTYPQETFINNIQIFFNLIEGVRSLKINCRILATGSADPYGIINPADIPLKETRNLNPINTYSVAKMSQEYISKIYVDNFGLDIVLTRSFNHIGAGQTTRFVIPNFVQQIVQKPTETMRVGNLKVIRDFLDVEDIVKAYYLLFQLGIKGEVYNVCSGKGYSIEEILKKIYLLVGYEVRYQINPQLIRPNDIPIIIGDNTKICTTTNWKPSIEITETLQKIIAYYKK